MATEIEPMPALTLRPTEPEVRLVNVFARPLDNAIAAARTCYSARGIVTPEVQVEGVNDRTYCLLS